jgi:hypothetical protein
MSHGTHVHGGTGAAPAGHLPFSPTEVASFHAEDRKAAAGIIGLMVGIFLIGIGLYLTVCYVCYTWA